MLITEEDLSNIAKELDAVFESTFALGFPLEDRVEIISEVLVDKFGLQISLRGLDSFEE
jgi:hypothetical protein